MAALCAGSLFNAVGFPTWGASPRELLRSALEDGWLSLEQIAGERLRVRLLDLTGHGIIDEGVSCPIKLVDDNRAIVSITWKDGRLQDIRINMKTALSNAIGAEVVDQITISLESHGGSSPVAKFDYFALGVEAQTARKQALAQRVPKIGRQPGGRAYAFKSLQGEVDQILDLLLLIEQDRLAHIPGLMARVRLLIYNRPLGLLQECAAWQDAPLTVFTCAASQSPLNIEPDNLDVFINLTGSAQANIAHSNPIDFDNWLELPAMTLQARHYSNLQITKQIGDTIGAHRDPDITPVIERLTKEMVNVAIPGNQLSEFSLMVARMVLALAQMLIVRETVGGAA